MKREKGCYPGRRGFLILARRNRGSQSRKRVERLIGKRALRGFPALQDGALQ